MKRFIGFIVLALWVVGGLLLTPGVSYAQGIVGGTPGIQIFDDDVNGISAITSGIPFGGNLVITQETATSPGSVIWDFDYISILGTATSTTTFSYNIFEQGATPAVLSDTLQFTRSPTSTICAFGGCAHGQVAFFSGPLDDTPLLTALPNGTPILETGALQDLLVSGIPHPTDLSVFGFQSDLDVTSVPEPMSLLLFGAGLVGMAVIGRKIKK